MADRCPHCGAGNPEKLPFCNECGEPIDKDLQFVMNVKKAGPAHGEQRQQSQQDYKDRPKSDEDEEEEKKFPVGIILVVAVVVVAAVLWFVMK